MGAERHPPGLTLALDSATGDALARAVARELAAYLSMPATPHARECFTEAEAADWLRVKRHQLRDARLRGEVRFHKVMGGQVRYTIDYLREYLDRCLCERGERAKNQPSRGARCTAANGRPAP